ncbi:MAG: hypothetical protein NC311_15250 [Muribaculaceae bacterium]|nr:hypothetical protein [Muribaculaceae bacterium]
MKQVIIPTNLNEIERHAHNLHAMIGLLRASCDKDDKEAIVYFLDNIEKETNNLLNIELLMKTYKIAD